MDNDDLPIGRILTRREALALLGVAGAGILAACAPGQSAATQATSVSTQATTNNPTQAPTSAPTQAATAANIAVQKSLFQN